MDIAFKRKGEWIMTWFAVTACGRFRSPFDPGSILDRR